MAVSLLINTSERAEFLETYPRDLDCKNKTEGKKKIGSLQKMPKNHVRNTAIKVIQRQNLNLS